MAVMLKALMARTCPGRMNRERGAGIPTALMVTVTVFLLGATWTRISVHEAERSTYERSDEQAFDAAEAGINAAMAALTTDGSFGGGSGILPERSGEWQTSVAPVNTGDPDDLRRRITATGWGPDQTDSRTVERTLEAEVELESIDGFDFALFAGAGDIQGDNHMTVIGDVYARDGITLKNNSEVQGDVISPAHVTTQGNTLITGDVRAGGDVTLDNNTTTVQGSVFSGGNVTVNARVVGDVQAGGTVSVSQQGQVDGNIAEYATPPPIREESLPTFTWDPANYSPAPTTWGTASEFYNDWSTNATLGLPYSGHHKIDDTVGLTLDKKWKIDANTTVVSDGKIHLTREVVAGSTETMDLVIISTSEEGIEISNNVTMPNNIHVLLFAPNGPVSFKNLKHFAGAVYGESVDADQNFTLTWVLPDVPGLDWSLTSDVHYRVILRVLRET